MRTPPLSIARGTCFRSSCLAARRRAGRRRPRSPIAESPLGVLIPVLVVMWTSIEFAPGSILLSNPITSAIDDAGNPVTPLITSSLLGGTEIFSFTTGTFADGPMVSTLEFNNVTIESGNPILQFAFANPVLTPDATGTGTSVFTDSYTASLWDGVNSMTLLQVDASGARPDPFGTAPGSVSLTALPLGSIFGDFQARADLSSLAGQTISLFFEVHNTDDGMIFSIDDDQALVPSSIKAVPEATEALLIACGLSGLILGSRRRRANGIPIIQASS